ncbi:MAG: hypothetical protein H3C57_01575 [Gammaproteobacteria bacterium]|nr:hypothetical protein [Gammaproteobacteria bacterium]
MNTAMHHLMGTIILASLGLASALHADEAAPNLGLSQGGTGARHMLPRLSATGAAEPVLAFELLVDAHCPAGHDQAELVISVANTVRSIPASQAAQPLIVQVPRRQLPWLANPAQICARQDASRIADAVGEQGERLFRLPAVTAAFATLSCSTGQGDSSAASSALPLDAWISCRGPGENGGG